MPVAFFLMSGGFPFETISGGCRGINGLRRLAKINRTVEHHQVRLEFVGAAAAANLVTRESKCRRNTVRPWDVDIRRVGTQSKRILVAGCSELKLIELSGLRGQR
jgi:hypothetical protein